MTPNPRELSLLLVTPTYPHRAHPMSGIFNQWSAEALAGRCRRLEVLSPRPYVPSLVRRRNPRWAAYAGIPSYEERRGIPVHRPPYLQLPGGIGAAWSSRAQAAMSRSVARRRHADAPFDAILSFDIGGGGSVAWRLGADLGLPAAGWATGGDIRVAGSPLAPGVTRTLRELDLVFYQNAELKALAATLLGRPSAEDLDPERHVVLSRGIPEPPLLDRAALREQCRAEWGISPDEILVVYVGRITRPKGAFELLEAAARTAGAGSPLRFVLIGAAPGFDESDAVSRRANGHPALRGRFLVLPACAPGDVWSALAAADVCAFPSHAEGMPNGLLEALAMELPAVAFDIPAAREIDPHGDFISLVPPFDPGPFATALVALAASPEDRRRRGRIGRDRVLSGFLVTRNMGSALERIAVLVEGGRGRGCPVPACRSAAVS